jgi:hypothetical protein
MKGRLVVLAGLVGLVGCVSLPQGPNVPVFVGYGKTLQQYQYDDTYCRQYATQQLQGGSEGHATALVSW